MKAAAGRIGDEIFRANKPDVIVLDFSGPDRKVTPLGQKLADEFSAALAKFARKIHVEDRSRITEAIKANAYPLDFVNSDEAAAAFVQDLNLQAFVMGQLSIEDDKVRVVISAYRVDNGKNLKSVRVAWTISGDDKKMATQNLADVLPAAAANSVPKNHPSSGKPEGYSTPSCLYCPRADYPPEARGKKIEGTVELEAIVDEDGQVRNIRILKPLPYGITTAAIATIRNWRLKPATGPDGKPATVRQIIEITFQSY